MPALKSLRILAFIYFTASLAGATAAAAAVTIYQIRDHSGDPAGITLGPDGNMWFTVQLSNWIGRITPAGTITEFDLPHPTSFPSGIVAGVDGRLWFTEAKGNRIGAMTTAGVLTEYRLATQGSVPYGITRGPGGTIWFAEEQYNNLAWITPDGDIAEYHLTAAAVLGIEALTRGPGDAVWFTESRTTPPKIGRIDDLGELTEFEVDGVSPAGIVQGPDGNIWFSFFGSPKIGRITEDGTITYFPFPDPTSRRGGAIILGPDGALWFNLLATVSGVGEEWRIARMSGDGAITEFPLPAGVHPMGLAFDRQGRLWFTDSGEDIIGVLNLETPCFPGDTVLCIDDVPGDRRFEARMRYGTSQGNNLVGDAHAVPLAPLGLHQGGLFYFTNPANPEILFKMVNACSSFDKYWAFFAAGTNVGFTVTVRDTRTGAIKDYTNADLHAAIPVQDTAAFPCTAAASVAADGSLARHPDSSPVFRSTGSGATVVDGAAPTCSPDAHTLCVQERYQVTVDYQTAQNGGLSGAATAVPLAPLGVTAGGLFYFTNPGSPQVLAKVLPAGCGVNNRIWFFFSATTNLGLTVTLTDTATGLSKTYTNADLHPATPVQDSDALACPTL